MTQQKTCPICEESFTGRANQAYCSNAHKAVAFRERRQQERQRILDYQQPTHIYFYSQANPSLHIQVCQELNYLQAVYYQVKEILGLQGDWEYQQLKDYLKQEVDGYRHLLCHVENTVVEEKYSLRYRQFMGEELVKRPAFFRLMLSTVRALRRNLLKNAKSEEVTVQIEPIKVKKLLKWQEKYRKLWMLYRRKHLVGS